MSVSHDDVRHIADLARIGIGPGRLDALVAELNGILAHMEVLGRVETPDLSGNLVAASVAPTPLRADTPTPPPMYLPRESIAPVMRDGFFMVPRLETHTAPADSDTDSAL